MKKLLRLLLLVILTFGLITLNPNYINGEETNAVDYGLVLKSDGTITDHNNNTISLQGLTYEDGVFKMNNFNFETTHTPAIEFKSSATIQIEGTNSIKLSGNSVEFIAEAYQSRVMIAPSDSTITIKSFDNSNTPTLNISNVNTNTTADESDAITFLGNLIIDSGTVNIHSDNIRNGKAIVLKTLKLVDGIVSASSSDHDVISLNGNQATDTLLSIVGNGTLKSEIITSGRECINIASTDSSISSEYNNLYSVKATGQTTTVLSDALFEYSSYETIVRLPNNEKALFVEITKKQTPTPEPTPSPSKKDESCEKVIGPTWHWNNDKGICEDYGVVGTSTR